MNQSPSENVSRFSCGDGRKAHGGKKKPNQAARPNLAFLCKLDCFYSANSILGNDSEKLVEAVFHTLAHKWTDWFSG